MAPPKRFWAKLKLSPKFLGTLPEFPTYMSKSRLKRLAQEERRSGSASLNSLQRSSPAPEGGNNLNNNNNNNNNNGPGGNNGGSTISNYKVNMGLKEGSTSGLTMNSIASGQYALDKSGKPCKRWVKRPRQFKSFTGFKVTYIAFEPKDPVESNKDDNSKVKEEPVLNTNTEATNTPAITPAPTPGIKIES